MENKKLNEDLGHVFSPRFIDPTFVENLHVLDPCLNPRWNPKKCRWEIWRKCASGYQYILTVQTVKGEYAHLDNRVFQKLFLSDTSKYANKFQYIQTLHLEDEKLAKMKIKEQDEFVRACHRDLAPVLTRKRTVVADPRKVKEQEKRVNDASS